MNCELHLFLKPRSKLTFDYQGERGKVWVRTSYPTFILTDLEFLSLGFEPPYHELLTNRDHDVVIEPSLAGPQP